MPASRLSEPAIVARTLSDQLVAVVRDRVVSGIAAPGQPIRQDALAAELGVSKIPLREALGRLEEEGLLRSHANRGYFVRALDAAEAEEVYALRLKLEPAATAAAARLADAAQRQDAIDALAALDRASPAGVGARNRDFHLALIRPGRQPITTTILERLHVLSERYVGKHLEPIGRDVRASGEHRDLLAAWLAGDADRVEALTRGHIARTLKDLRKQLRTSE